MLISYSLDKFKEKDKKFFVEMLSYVSPAILGAVQEGDRVKIEVSEEDAESVLNKLTQLSDMILNGQLNGKEINVKNLEDYTEVKTINNNSIFQTLLEKESIKMIDSGIYAYSGIFLKIYRYFDIKIEEFGRQTFDRIKEYEFPALYPIDKYERGGYFETFPHYIMFQTTMKNDLNVIERFSKNGSKEKNIFKEMKAPSRVLRNATCVPIYHFLRNQQIDDAGPQTFMVSGRCFRNEGNNVYEIARLNEFNMKEYVFVGSPEQCKEKIIMAKELWHFWITTFGLNCKICTANDSFFASNYKKLQFFQILGDAKQEFQCRLDDAHKYIAVGSANFHRTHFSKPYNIRLQNGNYAHSACFAFGLERLSYSLLCQKGLDTKRWDQATVKEIEKYGIKL